MPNEEIKGLIEGVLPSVKFDETGEFLNVMVEEAEFRGFAQKLRYTFNYDYLYCLTCVDWKTHLTVVYHFTSTANRQNQLVLKVNLDRNQPQIATVCDTWRTAELMEREVYEMFGVVFRNHPDLRRLILTDDFQGFPLRKDFEDPINMIKL